MSKYDCIEVERCKGKRPGGVRDCTAGCLFVCAVATPNSVCPYDTRIEMVLEPVVLPPEMLALMQQTFKKYGGDLIALHHTVFDSPDGICTCDCCQLVFKGTDRVERLREHQSDGSCHGGV